MIAEIMISEQQRIDQEAQMILLKEAKLKLKKLQHEAWGSDPYNIYDSNNNHHNYNHHHHNSHNVHHHHQNQDLSNLEIDILHTPGRMNTGRMSENSSGYGFREKEKKGGDVIETNHGKGKFDFDKNHETRVVLPIPCQRKPSR